MPETVTRPSFDHLVAAAEAVTAGTLTVGDEFVTPAGWSGLTVAARAKKPNRWHVARVDGHGEIVLAPHKGGRCYPVAYCLGEGRVAILRTAAMRTSAR